MCTRSQRLPHLCPVAATPAAPGTTREARLLLRAGQRVRPGGLGGPFRLERSTEKGAAAVVRAPAVQAGLKPETLVS